VSGVRKSRWKVPWKSVYAAEDLARGVIDGGVEHETRPAIFEPGVVTATACKVIVSLVMLPG
jgi:hypothetical protein